MVEDNFESGLQGPTVGSMEEETTETQWQPIASIGTLCPKLLLYQICRLAGFAKPMQ